MSYKSHTVVNDPIYGFISIPNKLIFDIVNHPYFQRLRRIHQLGLTNYVYPGARHSRFEHALGAMHLMGLSIRSLQSKGVQITDEEAIGAQIAILLHDIGHGPFSHTLEKILIKGLHHEEISLVLINKLNKEFDGKLELASQIFQGTYKKKFLHQLVSSQLDMDRMDYLNRDSFYSGVSEGIVNYDRIINKLNVANNELVVEVKGVYSVEKFITARRLMYWQVYLHKTTLGIDQLICAILFRAKHICAKEGQIDCNPFLKFFLTSSIDKNDFMSNEDVINHFLNLDDFDIISSIKGWILHEDQTLSYLAKSFINRNLFKVELSNEAFGDSKVDDLKAKVMSQFKVDRDLLGSYFYEGIITNNAYNMDMDNIKVLFPNGEVQDIAASVDLLNISAMSKQVKKHYICYPKNISH